MPLDPSIRARLDAVAALGLPRTEQLTPAEARAGLSALVSKQKDSAPHDIEVAAAAAATNHGPAIPLRIYTPPGVSHAPVVIYFHGGGWVTGNFASHDVFCRTLAGESRAVVVLVDYRLAPEQPYPAALEDCAAATDWVFEQAPELNADARRVIVAGDSAGGNLAAVVSIMKRDRGAGPSLAGQILLWPVTDYFDPPKPSYLENAEGFGLTQSGMIHFWNLYLAGKPYTAEEYAAPLRAPSLENLPPALIVTAQYDVLRDEGEEYATRLKESGVPVDYVPVAGVNHGFAVWPDHDPDLPQARDTRRQIAGWIARLPPVFLVHKTRQGIVDTG